MQERRWLYDRRNLTEAQRDLAAWIGTTDTTSAYVPGSIKDDFLYQRGVQAALPLLNMRAMKESSEAKFGAG